LYLNHYRQWSICWLLQYFTEVLKSSFEVWCWVEMGKWALIRVQAVCHENMLWRKNIYEVICCLLIFTQGYIHITYNSAYKRLALCMISKPCLVIIWFSNLCEKWSHCNLFYLHFLFLGLHCLQCPTAPFLT